MQTLVPDPDWWNDELKNKYQILAIQTLFEFILTREWILSNTEAQGPWMVCAPLSPMPNVYADSLENVICKALETETLYNAHRQARITQRIAHAHCFLEKQSVTLEKKVDQCLQTALRLLANVEMEQPIIKTNYEYKQKTVPPPRMPPQDPDWKK